MAALPHRNVSNIRPSITGSHTPNPGAPGSPHTPVRAISSNFASPSTLRAEEDFVVVELGNRSLRAGFAGDALPKVVIGFGPEEQRRAGDYRKWRAGHAADWRRRGQGQEWGEGHELWKLDLRGLDLGLVGDKIERALREAFTQHLLIDSRPRRIALVLPSVLPLPLLSTILDTVFNNFQSPTISLFSAPVLTTVAAGLRVALVVDIGWAETVITSVYEYREVLCRRTVRASKLLSTEMLKFLGKAVLSATKETLERPLDMDEKGYRKIVSFEECEEVVSRMAWCAPSKRKSPTPTGSEALSLVEKEDHIEVSMQSLNLSGRDFVSIPLSSTQPPLNVRLPFSALSSPCETAFFANGVPTVELDDEELPLHLLVYFTLLQLPVDVRSMCMSRVIFAGAASNMPGLRIRITDEVNHLIQERGWDPVQGAAIEGLRNNERIRASRSKQASGGPTEVSANEQIHRMSSMNPGIDEPEPNPYEDKLRRELSKEARPTVQGTLRVVESMGPWSGGSIVSQLKIPAVSIVEREQWLQHGISGATKQGETTSTEQRQSTGPGGLRAGQGERISWTLGRWG